MIEPIGCPETSVINYHYTLRDIPQERIFLSLRGGNLKLHVDKRWFEVPFDVLTEFEYYKPKLN